MGHKIAWFGEIRDIVRHFSTPEQVEIGVRLTEGVPARQLGRTVRVRLTPERALDWAAELAAQARNIRRRNGDYVAPRGENLKRYVGRLLRNFAEDTGVQDDSTESQAIDLIIEIMHQLEPGVAETVAERAINLWREESDETD